MTTNIDTGAVVTYGVSVNDNLIPDAVRVLSIYVDCSINRIPLAKVVLLDGDAATGTFETSSSATFVPGNKITIAAGYDSKNSVIFEGIITGQSIRIDDTVGSVLEVECRDMAVKMAVGPRYLSFSQQKDSDIISSLIANYPLSAHIAATNTIFPELIQYYVTDWDFVLERARANGMIVAVKNGKITVDKPDANLASVCKITYGDNMLAFNAKLDATTQLASVTTSAWDYKQQAIDSANSSVSNAGPGNLSSKTLSGVVGLSDYTLQNTTPLQSSELDNLSKARLTESSYSKICGKVKFMGAGLVYPGTYITLTGVGDRFNGDHLVSGVTHQISDGNWITEASVGLSPDYFSAMQGETATQVPAVRGLVNGVVKQMYQDPDSQFRILVNVPVFGLTGNDVWARLSNFYSTSGAGAFFLPEVGDEVVLGFLNDDPRYPVILGSMYSAPAINPFTGLSPNVKNSLKAIVSKSGISMHYDDENIVFTVSTPNKNTISLNDKDQQITIQDGNQNSIVMSASGITIKSAKDINIQAGQYLNISGNMGIKVSSSDGDVSTSAVNINETAQSTYTAQAAAMAKVQGGMQLTLKGAMVMIN